MIEINKFSTFHVPENILRIVMIESIKKLIELEERLISPWQAFA